MTTRPELVRDTVIVRSQDQLTGEIDREVVLLDLDSGTYYQLNGAGSRVWELLETPTTVAAVVATLVEEFEVDPSACERQVLDFARGLLAEGLVHLTEPATSGGG